MDLPSKILRDVYGIDSFERAIVWSSLILRAGYQLSEDTVIKDAVQITLQLTGTGENLVQNIVIKNSLLIENQSLIEGANLLGNIKERFLGSLDWVGGNCEPSIGDFNAILPDPQNLSLEAYYYWACQNVLASDINQYRNVQIIPIYKGLVTPFALDTVVRVKFDYPTYLKTNNLVCAVGSVLDDDSGGGLIPSEGFNNITQLNNLLQLSNG